MRAALGVLVLAMLVAPAGTALRLEVGSEAPLGPYEARDLLVLATIGCPEALTTVPNGPVIHLAWQNISHLVMTGPTEQPVDVDACVDDPSGITVPFRIRAKPTLLLEADVLHPVHFQATLRSTPTAWANATWNATVARHGEPTVALHGGVPKDGRVYVSLEILNDVNAPIEGTVSVSPAGNVTISCPFQRVHLALGERWDQGLDCKLEGPWREEWFDYRFAYAAGASRPDGVREIQGRLYLVRPLPQTETSPVPGIGAVALLLLAALARRNP